MLVRMDTANLTRRHFLAGSLVAPALASAAAKKPSLTGQFYIWTQYFQKEKKSLADGVAEAIAGTRRAGYSSIELMSSAFAPGVREKTFAALKEHRMAVPIVYNGGAMHEAAGADATIAETLALADTVKPLRTALIDFNPNPKPRNERKSDAELATQSQAINRLAAELRKRGLGLELHFHAPEMAENAREWRYTTAHTDPNLVSFCIDVHWAYRGGQDYMTILREAGRRIASLHLRNSKNGVWTEDFGPGDVDYTRVAAHLESIRFTGYLTVELAYEKDTAITRPLEEDLRLSRIYAEKTFKLT